MPVHEGQTGNAENFLASLMAIVAFQRVLTAFFSLYYVNSSYWLENLYMACVQISGKVTVRFSGKGNAPFQYSTIRWGFSLNYYQWIQVVM